MRSLNNAVKFQMRNCCKCGVSTSARLRLRIRAVLPTTAALAGFILATAHPGVPDTGGRAVTLTSRAPATEPPELTPGAAWLLVQLRAHAPPPARWEGLSMCCRSSKPRGALCSCPSVRDHHWVSLCGPQLVYPSW